MKATLSNYKQAPRKVRLLADLVRGKAVTEALGLVMKRSMARARGRATPIRHRTSHVDVTLAVKTVEPKVAVRGKAKASR